MKYEIESISYRQDTQDQPLQRHNAKNSNPACPLHYTPSLASRKSKDKDKAKKSKEIPRQRGRRQHSLSTTPSYRPSAMLISAGHFPATRAFSLTTLPCTSSNSRDTSLAATMPSAKFARVELRRFVARAWRWASSRRRALRFPELFDLVG